jgi:tRNA G46 methylase TrmB
MTKVANNYEQRLREFPSFAFGGDDVFRHRGRWNPYFAERIGLSFGGKIILEIGCGDAAFLGAIAAKHPGVGFIGLDWKFKSIHTGAERAAGQDLHNIALLRGRAQDLGRIFAAGEVDEVWVFHPEPCAEPEQLKNRLIAKPFLADVHQILRDASSVLAVKTDHAGYYQWVLAMLGEPEPAAFHAARELATGDDGRSAATSLRLRARDLMRQADMPQPSDDARARFVVAATSPDFWHDEAALAHAADRCFAGAVTSYEARFVNKRRPIYYIELRKR